MKRKVTGSKNVIQNDLKQLWKRALRYQEKKNISKEITIYRSGLSLSKRYHQEDYYFQFTIALAKAVLQLLRIRKSKACFKESLALFKNMTRSRKCPRKYKAVAYKGLADVLCEFEGNITISSMRQIIHYYKKAKKIFLVQNKYLECAKTDVCIAQCYEELRARSLIKNTVQQRKHYESALKRLPTRKKYLKERAMIHYALLLLYAEDSNRKHEKNLVKSLAHAKGALLFYTRRRRPDDWAAIQERVGESRIKIRSSNRIKNARRALENYKRALRVYKNRKYQADIRRVGGIIRIIESTLDTL